MTEQLKHLRNANQERSLEWMGEPCTIADTEFRAIELAGEVGEALNVVKKYLRTRSGVRGGWSYEDTVRELADELADVIICTDRLAEVYEIDLWQAVRRKFNKTSTKQGLRTKL